MAIVNIFFMLKLEYETEGKKHTLNIPEKLQECNGAQIVGVIDFLEQPSTPDDVLKNVCCIPENIVANLSTFQKYKIIEQLRPLLYFDIKEQVFNEWKFPTMKINNTTFYGLTSNFSNVTWGEFLYTDQCIINGYHQAAIAAMFRPERRNFNHETDPRIPFTTQGTTYRFNLFNDLKPSIKTAIILNYKAMRAAAIESFYTALFPYFGINSSDDDEVPTPEDETQNNTFSWVNVHRNLLGENIQYEPIILKLPVHTVLARLNQAAIDSKKTKQNNTRA